MKKQALLLVPLITVLTSCGLLDIGMTGETHSAGIAGHDSSIRTYVDQYTYFSGDEIDETNTNVANLTFSAENAFTIGSSAETFNSIVSCDVDDVFNSVTEAENVGVIKDFWLFVGADSTYTDGYLTLKFDINIKDIKIEACPVYFEKYGFEEDFRIDENVAVAVNNSSYIRLSSLRDEVTGDVNTTPCRYHMPDNTKEIKIKVGQRRAFIRKIVLYY